MFSDWKGRAPALSQFAPYLGLVSLIGSFFLLPFTRLWIDSVFKSYQVWRIFTSPFVDASFFQCIFGAVFFYICGSKIERKKGSIFLLHLLIVSSLLTNLMFTFFGGFFAYAPFFGFSTTIQNKVTGVETPHPSFTSTGLYPLVFSIFVMETSLRNEERSRFLCFPWMVMTRSLPLVFLAFYQLFGLISGIVKFDAICGVAIGYLITYVLTDLQISPTRARNWEHASWLKWLSNRENFVAIDNGGTALPGVWSNDAQGQAQGPGFSMFGGGQQGGSGGSQSAFSMPGGGGSGASSTGGGSGSGSGGASTHTDHSKSSSTSRLSAFSGQGHSLGGNSSSGGSAGSASAAAQNGTSRTSRAGGTHPLALRYAEKQQSDTADEPSMYGDTENTEMLIDIDDDQGQTQRPQDRIPLFDIQLQHLMELGYTREDATPALEFSSGDVEKAVAYLQGRVEVDD